MRFNYLIFQSEWLRYWCLFRYQNDSTMNVCVDLDCIKYCINRGEMGNSSDCHAAIKSSQRILHMHDRAGEAYSSSKYWKRYFYDMHLIIIVPHTIYSNSPEALCSLILRFLLLLDGLTCNFLMLLVLAQLSSVVRETFFVSSSHGLQSFEHSRQTHSMIYVT